MDASAPTDEMAAMSSDGAGPDPRRWLVLVIVVVAQLMVVLDASVMTIALPSIQRSLHMSVANRQWIITAYTLAFGGFLLLGGRIADFRGRRRILVVGLIGFAGSSALGGLAVDQGMLIGSRALQGAFAALMAPAALSILTITFQHDAGERAKAFGAYGAVSGAGAAHRRTCGRCPHGIRIVAVVPSDQRSDRFAGRSRECRGSSARAGPAGPLDTTYRVCCCGRQVWSAWSTASLRRSPTAGRQLPHLR